MMGCRAKVKGEMSRAEWGNSFSHSLNCSTSNGIERATKWCSYKQSTLLACSINVVIALYMLHALYNSLYLYPYNETTNDIRYTTDQFRRMEESNRIRMESEPQKLVKLVENLQKDVLRENSKVEVPEPLRWKIAEELILKLRAVNASGNGTDRYNAVESWRVAKLREVNIAIHGKTKNSTIPPEEAGVLSKALNSGWADFSKSIGLWLPVQIINKKYDYKPEDVEEFDREILPGRRPPPECHAELRSDYDGVAVKWGLTHPKESSYDCCMACLDQAKNAKPGEMKCNIWVYCPSQTGCYSPDIYEHKNQECWLKYAEQPKVNFKERYSDSYRSAHPGAPLIVPWVSGVVTVSFPSSA